MCVFNVLNSKENIYNMVVGEWISIIKKKDDSKKGSIGYILNNNFSFYTMKKTDKSLEKNHGNEPYSCFHLFGFVRFILLFWEISLNIY